MKSHVLSQIELDNLTQQIVKKLSPNRIMLFGSYAKGDYHAGSDLDLCILLETEQDWYERRLLFARRIRFQALHVEAHIYTEKEWETMIEEEQSLALQIQQEAEKVLKAFLFLKGERAILSHSTLKIAEQCNSYDSHFKAIFEACEQLDIFYIPTRYPNGIPDGVPYEFFKKHHAVTGQHAYSRIFDLVSPYFSSLADSH